jgi:hypothetical protein
MMVSEPARQLAVPFVTTVHERADETGAMHTYAASVKNLPDRRSLGMMGSMFLTGAAAGIARRVNYALGG